MFAEVAYLFRHALVREAAYELQPPTERAQLHGIAFDVLEAVLLALDESELKSAALELADHAAQARNKRPDLAAAELRYLRLAYDVSRERHALRDTVGIIDRLLALPQFPADERDMYSVELGITLMNTGDPHRSREVLQPLAERARNAGNLGMLTRALISLALLALRLGNRQECEELYAELLPIADKVGDPQVQMTAKLNYGTMLFEMNRLDEGRPILERARELAIEVGDKKARALCETNLAFRALTLGDLKAAEAQYRRAYEFAEAAGGLGSRLNCLMHLSGLEERGGRLSEAEATLKAALKLARESGMSRYESSSLGGLANLAWTAGRRDEAMNLLQESLGIAVRSGNARLKGMWGCRLAVCRAELGERAEAEAQWRNSMVSLRKAGLQTLIDEQTRLMTDLLGKAGLPPLGESSVGEE